MSFETRHSVGLSENEDLRLQSIFCDDVRPGRSDQWIPSWPIVRVSRKWIWCSWVSPLGRCSATCVCPEGRPGSLRKVRALSVLQRIPTEYQWQWYIRTRASRDGTSPNRNYLQQSRTWKSDRRCTTRRPHIWGRHTLPFSRESLSITCSELQTCTSWNVHERTRCNWPRQRQITAFVIVGSFDFPVLSDKKSVDMSDPRVT